eukprot:TRINITY_DN5459_c0_g1_i2.p1 TRINITY_DN5459_c0_g1~~TRINITY_DN5459_c0_g1_i2.p1  ORF type:complete len:834 (-),score=300.37 TRINITY_DN5459_c0_g1_i2:9-2510(-)
MSSRGGRGGRGGSSQSSGRGGSAPGGRRDMRESAPTKPKTMALCTNMYPLVFRKDFQTELMRYEVHFLDDQAKELEKPSKDAKRALTVQAMDVHFKDVRYAYDGDAGLWMQKKPDLAAAMASLKIDDKFGDRNGVRDKNGGTFPVTSARGGTLYVQFVPVGYEEINHSHLQIILSFSMFLAGLQKVEGQGQVILKNRSIFFDNKFDLLDEKLSDLIIHPGVFQSFRNVTKGLVLNVDLGYLLAVRHDLSVMEWLNARARSAGYKTFVAGVKDAKFIKRLQKDVKGMMVLTNYHVHDGKTHQRRHVILNIEMQSHASNSFFEIDGKKTSVIDYYKKNFNIDLKDKFGALLVERPKKANETKGAWFPAELCYFKKGQQRGDLTADERNAVIEYTRSEPPERFRRIKENLSVLSSNPTFKAYAVDIDHNSPLKVEAKVLPSPRIDTADGASHANLKATFYFNNRFKKSVTGKTPWALLCHENFDENAFLDVFFKVSDDAGMELADPVIKLAKSDTFEAKLREVNPKEVRFVFIVLPDDPNKERHDNLKAIADLELVIPSKCVLDNKRGKLTNSSVLINLLLTINSKIGGWNWNLYKDDLQQMLGFDPSELTIFGMDVCHGNDKSTASLVMSRNKNFVEYCHTSRDQKARQEIVPALKEMATELFKRGFSSPQALPPKILIYRDGVGEGMYDEVRRVEMKEMEEVILEMYPKGRSPKVTWVIVQKRNHLRCTENPPPGTLLDADVVDKGTHNFYLYSHFALQGTARPTHYQVLQDQIGLGRKLPELTYALCHMHMGCNKSVSMPAPVFYADAACGRAHLYYDGKRTPDFTSKTLSMI